MLLPWSWAPIGGLLYLALKPEERCREVAEMCLRDVSAEMCFRDFRDVRFREIL